MQGIFQFEKDDCLNACIASILEIPLSIVPKFSNRNSEWFFDLQSWLKDYDMGTTPIFKVEDMDIIQKIVPRYSIGSIKSDNEEIRLRGHRHAVVCLNGRIVWGPIKGTMPGTVPADDYMILYPLDPVRRMADAMIAEGEK